MTESTKKETLFVIKIGGNIIDDALKLKSFLETFASITGKKILVHGGGKIATQIGEELGIVSKYTNGRRITDDETIEVVTMVYGGLVNKKIVASLQSYNCNAIGITGADANCIPAFKRKVTAIDFGWVGDIEQDKIKAGNWELFLNNHLTPVVAPLTHDGKGHMLNTNADTIASVISIALSQIYNVVLIYCFEKNGVLEDINDDHSVIPLIDLNIFKDLRSKNKVAEGILPKIENALASIDAGVYKIIIGSADDLIHNASANIKGTTFIK